MPSVCVSAMLGDPNVSGPNLSSLFRQSTSQIVSQTRDDTCLSTVGGLVGW